MNATLNQVTGTDPLTSNRYPIYSAVHKGLRAFMAETLLAVGKMDPYDDCETAETLDKLRLLLTLCRNHLHHENELLHAALERVQPNSALHTADDHVEHEKEIGALELRINELASTSGSTRATVAYRLYLELSVFVGENFVHMNVEETENQAVLIAHYSDAELLALEGQVTQRIPPQESTIWRRWMISHMNSPERVRAFTNARNHAPPEVYEGLLALAREVLSERDWYKLESGLM